jgi:hypothetical protein
MVAYYLIQGLKVMLVALNITLHPQGSLWGLKGGYITPHLAARQPPRQPPRQPHNPRQPPRQPLISHLFTPKRTSRGNHGGQRSPQAWCEAAKVRTSPEDHTTHHLAEPRRDKRAGLHSTTERGKHGGETRDRARA